MATKTIEPTDAELKAVIGTWNSVPEVEDNGYLFRDKHDMTKPEIGEIVVIHSHGRYRRGIVTSVGLVNAKVALTTPTAVEESAAYGTDLTRVKGKAVPFYMIGRKNPAVDIETDHGEALKINEVVDEERATELDILDPTELDILEPPEVYQNQTVSAGTGSSVVVVLEKVWEKIRQDTPELPPVVIVTGSGMIGPARWGHFRANGWTERSERNAATNLVLGEMFVAGETLARGASHTLETMLHEAAHVLAQVRSIKDTSRQGRWHNQKFRSLAEGLGLEYGKTSAHPQIGFSEVTLTPGTIEQYATVIDELDQAIQITVELPSFLRPVPGDNVESGAGESMGHHHGRQPRAGSSGPTTNNVRATCGCPDPRIIRASRKVLEGSRIVCEECGEAFLDRS